MTHRIVVLGAGYAGTHAAGRLARRLAAADTEITLVNSAPDFVERVRLHQVATGQELPPRPLTEVFAGTHVRLRTAIVTALDVERRTVSVTEPDGSDTDGSEEIGYDHLVYALGSTTADHRIPGVAEHAHHVADRGAALRTRAALAELPAGATVLVVGGGLTGIEAATEIAETRPDLAVELGTAGRLGDWLNDKARRHLGRTAERLGIATHEQFRVSGVVPDGVTTARGHRRADLVLWTTGFVAHPLAAGSGLGVHADGQVVVDRTMRSVSHPDVYVVGDAARAEGADGRPLRMSCASGIPTAWRAADALAARLTGHPVQEKPIGYVQQCISLGRRDGIIQFVTAGDRARSGLLTGRVAAWYKEIVCAGAAWSVSHPTMLLPTRTHPITGASDRADAPVVG